MTPYIVVRDDCEGFHLFRNSEVILFSKKDSVTEYDTLCSRELRCRTLFKEKSKNDFSFYVYLNSLEIKTLKDKNKSIFPSTIFVYGSYERFGFCCQIRVCVNIKEVVGQERDEKISLIKERIDKVIADCNSFSLVRDNDNYNKYNKEKSLESLKSEGKLFILEPISINPFAKSEYKIHEDGEVA